ncbi:MAG TPA: serine/threonine-protein kinase [Pyrinomonadaceae bacterium]|nr:serine/threonine-protein kinase [Pyrinomonadaceae bacterium]
MPSDNWKEVKKLLNEVLQTEPSERQLFLQNSGCPREICAEVESLIAFETKAENFMKLSALEFSKDFFAKEVNSSNLLIGQQIGVYQIVSELGMGGMGAVYLAERNDGKINQKAAIKMLKREFNIERFRHSFKRESSILAKLNHPNIARLLDAGTTDDGIPYLIMEYVEGETIDNFCEHNNLALKMRLKLFNKVCEAVSFAHQNLIIHRDLKPSNILVTPKGEVKLLDFGISKILNDEQTQEKTALTMLGAMTPEYASPEQIRGEKVTTSTDIYSLGVVLYKILTGNLPYSLKDKNNGNLMRIITETEPSRPSSQNTNLNSAIRNPQLKGDIDNIILKSLRKEPERRYKTVEQFSADIWRFIDGLPILARPSTISYRSGKFFQRNKISVIAALVVFLSLIIGIAVALWQTREAHTQAQIAFESKKLAEIEADKAKTEQQKSEKVTKFISKIIGYANPAWYAEGANSNGQARVIDAIEDLSDKIDMEFTDEADIAAELHHKFAEIFHMVGKNSSGEQQEKVTRQRNFHALRALELRKQFYGERHELVAKDLFYACEIIGKTPEEQAKILAEAIQMMRETNPKNLNYPYMLEAYTANMILPEFEELHEPYRNAVIPPTDENSFQIAEQMLRESLPIFRLHYKADNSAIYGAECKLSYALAMQEKWTDFDGHFALCQQGKDKFGNKQTALKSFYELVEKVLAEKNKSSL